LVLRVKIIYVQMQAGGVFFEGGAVLRRDKELLSACEHRFIGWA